MKIKTKLVLGIGFLFAMVALLTVLSIWYINRLSGETKSILTNNYHTIDYSRRMLIVLDGDITSAAARNEFRLNLEKQKGNITEVGESELTQKIETDFNLVLLNTSDSVKSALRKDLNEIMLLNMQAIQRKSSLAESTADTSIFWITVAGTLCFLLGLIVLFNLPANIADPIRELTERIKQIAERNYSQRVHFQSSSEFGELADAFNSMAEKLEEYSQTSLAGLMIEKKRIDALINRMSEPVIGLDENRDILFMNNTALSIAGLSAENVVGKSAFELAGRNDLLKTLLSELITGSAAEIDSKTGPLRVYSDGKESYFEKEIVSIRIVPTGERDEKAIGDFVLLKNVTPYKERDSAKTNFIATVSHELKTPISSIRMGLQLLADQRIGAINTDQQKLLDSIGEDTERLLKITAELLNVTQLESGSIQMNLAPADVSEIMTYAIRATASAAVEKGITIVKEQDEHGSPVLVDAEKTAWVLTNLISNAIRYSDEGSSISLRVEQEGSQTRVSVTDRGQGIAAEYIGRIFERYFRIPGSHKQGTGLGLSISKEFIEAQGGQIGVTSDLGVGSTFFFVVNSHT